MLKNILISKVRIKLLEQFFLNPSEKYHVRGLVRILDEEINAIRRELLNLESAGILKSHRETNKIIFVINNSNSIVEDLRELILKSSELGTKIGKIAKECGKTEAVIMSSAFLNKVYKDENDIDFLFIGDFDTKKLASLMKEVETQLDRELRLSALSVIDFDFAKKKRTPVILNIFSNDFVVISGSIKKLVV